MTVMYSFEELQKVINAEIERRLSELTAGKPIDLYSPVAYSLSMGGKRLRPVLLLMAYNMFSEELDDALPAALAIEIFHNFTLLHDDIMDNSRFRRSRPAVHVQFGENTAILAGDAMAFISYRYLMESSSPNIIRVLDLFTGTALEVCEGQQYDMVFEKRMDVSESEYLEMIRLKTAVLLGCSLKAGGLLAGADHDISDQLYLLGINLGLAFQLQDDLLDTYGDQKVFGKKIGSDILGDKKTYLLIKALEISEGKNKSTLDKWVSGKPYVDEDKINGVIEIYNKLGIKSIVENKIDIYFKKSFKILDDIPLKEKQKVPLKELCYDMAQRKY